jgi:hypothetical protein
MSSIRQVAIGIALTRIVVAAVLASWVFLLVLFVYMTMNNQHPKGSTGVKAKHSVECSPSVLAESR